MGTTEKKKQGKNKKNIEIFPSISRPLSFNLNSEASTEFINSSSENDSVGGCVNMNEVVLFFSSLLICCHYRYQHGHHNLLYYWFLFQPRSIFFSNAISIFYV